MSAAKPLTRLITNKMCPFAQKAWLALEVSNAPYELVEIDLYGTNGKPDWFWKLNPKGQVPVLVYNDGETVLPDSDLILDRIGTAIDEGKCLVPTDEKEQQCVEDVRRIISEFLPIGKAAVGSRGKKVEKMWTKLQELETIADDDGPYLCGPSATVADCAAFPFLYRVHDEFGSLESNGNCPKLQKWFDLRMKEPAFSKTVQRSWWWWW